MDKITLGDITGNALEEEFKSFDLTEVQKILLQLQNTDPLDLAHAELIQQQSLRCADILAEYLGRVVKTLSYLEGKVNTTKNKIALNYKSPDGGKVTADMRKFASESAEEVEAVQESMARAKASKIVLEKKYDIVIKYHHHAKDIAAGLRRTILGHSNLSDKIPECYE